MSRQAFLSRLRAGLAGLPPRAIEEIAADYEAHFAEGEAAGRTEAEVAAALGDPVRLARELRAEAGLKRWEAERNPSAAAGAIFAVLGLGALDVLVLLPILIGVGGVLLGCFIAVIVAVFAGGVMMIGAGFYHGPGGGLAALLTGLGMIAGSVSGGAVLTLITTGLLNLLVWYGRLHFRLLKPAIDPEGRAS
jgi:uncharacterized membrane protein